MGDGFRFIAVVAEAILMLANLMQISVYKAFSKMEPGCDDLFVPNRWRYLICVEIVFSIDL